MKRLKYLGCEIRNRRRIRLILTERTLKASKKRGKAVDGWTDAKEVASVLKVGLFFLLVLFVILSLVGGKVI